MKYIMYAALAGICISGYALFSHDISTVPLQANSVFSHSEERQQPDTFSIELSPEDKTLRILLAGSVSVSSGVFPSSLPSSIKQVLQTQNAVFTEMKYPIIDPSLFPEEQKGSTSSSFLSLLAKSNITDMIFLSDSLFSKGKFFYDLSLGEIQNSSISPLLHTQKKTVSNGIHAVDIYAYKASEDPLQTFIQTLRQTQNASHTTIVYVSFASQSDAITKEKQGLARSLIDAGADMVIGTGSTEIEPIESYNNGYILYGMGAFYSDNQNSEGIFIEYIESANGKEIFIHPFEMNEKGFSLFSQAQKIIFFASWDIFSSFSPEQKSAIANGELIPPSQ